MPDQNNEFPQRYQNFSDRKLLDIVEHHRDYVPEAVAAAKAELASRDLSEEEMNELKTEIERLEARRINWDWMNSKLVQRFLIWWGTKEQVQKIPLLTALGLAIWMIVTAYRRGDWDWTYYIIRNGVTVTGYELMLWVPYFAGIAAVILLALRKKAGWIIATSLASGSAAITLYTAAVGLYNYLFIVLPNFYVPGVTIWSLLFFTAVSILIAAGLIIVLHLKRVRQAFRVETFWVILANWIGIFWYFFVNVFAIYLFY